jgi:hypothetical protein
MRPDEEEPKRPFAEIAKREKNVYDRPAFEPAFVL